MIEIDWQAIKAEHRIEDVLMKRGMQLRRQSGSLTCKCPIHGEQRGQSFSIDTKKQLWRCFGKCGIGGDVITLICELDGVDKIGAAEILTGQPLRGEDGPRRTQNRPRRSTAPPVPEMPPGMRTLPCLPETLWEGQPRHWEAVAALRKLPHHHGVQAMAEHGVLRYFVAYDQPAYAVLDVDNPCNVQVRRLDGGLWFGDKKVMGIRGNWGGWPVGLTTALHRPTPPRELLWVEGTGDFIAAWHCCVDGHAENAIPVAMFGASNDIHPGALTLLDGHTAVVRLIEQHDEAGAAATARWRPALESVGLDVEVCRIPTPGHDLNDHLSSGKDLNELFQH